MSAIPLWWQDGDGQDAELPRPVVYSIVIPAFNEEESLPSLIDDLVRVLPELGEAWEVLIVDDGSSDRTFEIANDAARRYPRFAAVKLARNFGHQVALTAGLAHASGAAVVTMDADRQHPVDVIIEMAERWRDGYDVAYGVMLERPSETLVKRTTSDAFYRVLNRLSDTPMPSNAGDFRLMDRRVVDAFLQMPERGRYIRGMISWLGFEQIAVPYVCAPRHAGSSTYTMRRMVSFAFDALFSFSTWPLRFGMAFGFFVSVLAVVVGLLTIWMRLQEHTVPGWATIVVVMTFLGGAQLTLLGVVGQYIARIYDEVKSRPLYTEQLGTRGDRARRRQHAIEHRDAPRRPHAPACGEEC